MKSKLLQKQSYSQTHQSDEVIDDQQENNEDSSEPWRERENPPGHVSPATGAQARRDFSGHPKHACERQHRLR
jgi:hypothetical protein